MTYINLGLEYLYYKLLYFRDLSHSSMKVLPTSGLKSLEILRIENVLSMTVIPSVYLFSVCNQPQHYFILLSS